MNSTRHRSFQEKHYPTFQAPLHTQTPQDKYIYISVFDFNLNGNTGANNSHVETVN